MNTQNQLTTTDGPAGSLALDPRSALRAIKFVVQSKRGVRGQYKAVKTIFSKTANPITKSIPDAVALEKELNNGLLAQDAEAAYARAGFYDKEIFRVHIGAAEWSGNYV